MAGPVTYRKHGRALREFMIMLLKLYNTMYMNMNTHKCAFCWVDEKGRNHGQIVLFPNKLKNHRYEARLTNNSLQQISSVKERRNCIWGY